MDLAILLKRIRQNSPQKHFVLSYLNLFSKSPPTKKLNTLVFRDSFMILS